MDSVRQSDPALARTRVTTDRAHVAPDKYKFITCLVWGPTLPLLRLATLRFPSARTYLFSAAIVVANLHGFWLIQNPDLSDEALGIQR